MKHKRYFSKLDLTPTPEQEAKTQRVWDELHAVNPHVTIELRGHWDTEEAAAAWFKRRIMEARIENDFTYHAPKPGQPEKYVELRDTAKALALKIIALTPASREQSLALTKLEEVIFWANASIARHE